MEFSLVRMVCTQTTKMWTHTHTHTQHRMSVNSPPPPALEPKGYLVYHQVRAQKFYLLPTRCLCFEWLLEQTAKEERKKKVKNENGIVE